MPNNSGCINIFHIFEFSSIFLRECHDIPRIFFWSYNLNIRNRFQNHFNHPLINHIRSWFYHDPRIQDLSQLFKLWIFKHSSENSFWMFKVFDFTRSEFKLLHFQDFTIESSLNESFDIHSGFDQRNWEVFRLYQIHYSWYRENSIKSILTEKSLLDNIHMEHSQKTTAES